MRNMEKIASMMDGQFRSETGLSYYDMESSELLSLVRMCAEGKMVEAIAIVFKYGFVLGHRATLAGKVKKRL